MKCEKFQQLRVIGWDLITRPIFRKMPFIFQGEKNVTWFLWNLVSQAIGVPSRQMVRLLNDSFLLFYILDNTIHLADLIGCRFLSTHKQKHGNTGFHASLEFHFYYFSLDSTYYLTSTKWKCRDLFAMNATTIVMLTSGSKMKSITSSNIGKKTYEDFFTSMYFLRKLSFSPSWLVQKR